QLGHVQRGGMPGAFDRLLGTRLAAKAVEQIALGEFGVLMGLNKGAITATPYAEVVGKTKTLDPWLFELAKKLGN
ncbi:MAG: 6-phosphofructokinase, partial [Anaerolineae bacterium]|nr:6-phosphofructokinase [Anaerolineae bacterium]